MSIKKRSKHSEFLHTGSRSQPKENDVEELSDDEKTVVSEHVTMEDVVRYFVCKGRSIATKRGILVGKTEIFPSDLSGGEQALNVFVTSGHVESFRK